MRGAWWGGGALIGSHGKLRYTEFGIFHKMILDPAPKYY